MISKHTVLVVDNEMGTRESLRWILKQEYQVRMAENPTVALRMLQAEPIDIVFSDICMEPMDGVSLLRSIKSMWQHVQVIMMTAFASQDSVLASMRNGALDYLMKPFHAKQVLEAVRRALAKRAQNIVEERVLSNLKKTVENGFKGSVDSLMQALGAKDIYTFSHSRRTAEIFATFSKRHGFSEAETELYRTMATLHDIGKIGISDAILKKTGPLTQAEYEEIKLHPKLGYHIVKHLGLDEDALDIVIHHQERYDGKGYPHGLAGKGIPRASRLFSVVDAYDAMRRTRSYHRGFSQVESLQELRKNAGTQFDPEAVCDFEKMVQENAAHY